MAASGTSLRFNAGYLASAGMIEYGMQLLLPVILVRYLDPNSFAQYRMAWLMAATALAIAPLSMAQTLFHFLPHASRKERRVYVGNTLMYLAAAGCTTALVAFLGHHLLPGSVQLLRDHSYVVPLFLGFWVLVSIVDVLPIAEGRARWQAGMVVFLAVVRISVIGAAAVVTADIGLVLMALCLTALIKGLLIVVYEISQGVGISMHGPTLWRQLRYALPFAVGNGFFHLRVQTDQWVVAAKFPAEIFAIVSVAAVVVALSNLVRLPVNNALLPRVGALVAQHDMPGVQGLLAKGFTGIALLLLPFLGAIIVCASELVEIVYTAKYSAAAPVMQVYLIGQAAGIFAAGHLMVVAQCGRQAMIINGLALLGSLALSLIGVALFGYIGAAMGSVGALLLCEYWSLRIVSRAFGTTPARLIALRKSLTILGAVTLAVAATLVVRHVLLDALAPFARLLCEVLVYGVLVALIGLALGCRAMFANVFSRGV